MNKSKALVLGTVLCSLMLAAVQLAAHHSFAAQYDRNKQATLTGPVTKIDWINPHARIFMDVTDEKTGKVVAVFPVEDESEIMIITQQGKLIRIEANDIRKTGRSAQGVRLIKTDAGDKVTSASLVEAAAEEESADVTD